MAEPRDALHEVVTREKKVSGTLPGEPGIPAEEFCRTYWYPLYAFLRHSGYPAAESQDHVQSFFVYLLKENPLAAAQPERGRLRNFLITLLTRHVAARRERGTAKKRGGNVPHVPLDWADAEMEFVQLGSSGGLPEEAYRLALAKQLVAQGIEKLRGHYEKTGKLSLFEELLPALEGPLEGGTYDEVAARLGLNPANVRVASMRMRERFRLAVKASAAAVLGIPDGPLLDAELKDLFCSNSRPSGV